MHSKSLNVRKLVNGNREAFQKFDQCLTHSVCIVLVKVGKGPFIERNGSAQLLKRDFWGEQLQPVGRQHEVGIIFCVLHLCPVSMADGNEANQGEKDEVAVLGIDFGIRVAGIEDKAFVGNSVHGQKGVAGVNQCGSGLSKEGGHGLYPNPL